MIRLTWGALLLLAAVSRAQDYGENHRFKLKIGGENRKGVLFLPKHVRKGEIIPLLVAVPDTRGKAYLELDQWQQQAYERRFAVFSIDIESSGLGGWSPRDAGDALKMSRDMEAVTEGMAMSVQLAKEKGVTVDMRATVITAWSGGTYLAAWLGLRRPDLFLAVCLRGPVFHREAVKWGKLETVPPDFDQRIFIYRGELDNPRVIEQTELAVKTLKEAGYKRVNYRVVAKMIHESRPDIFLDWYYALLRETAKGRSEARKIAAELAKISEMIEKKRAGAYGKLHKLVEREKRAGFAAGAATLMAEIMAKAEKRLAEAENLVASNDFGEALAVLKEIERGFVGLPIAKQARARAAKIRKSDGYKANEMLTKAKQLRQRGKLERAADLLEKIATKYPKTAAGAEAALLLKS